ncbi:MAG: chemotaxis protein CheW [Spirochaetia bacterium]
MSEGDGVRDGVAETGAAAAGAGTAGADEGGAVESSGGTHLVFGLAGEHYAAPVGDVEEVLEWQPVTVVPRCPDYLLGIINVRGSLIPVVDLRRRFGMEAGAAASARHILVVLIEYAGERLQMGLVVDTVEGVIDLDEAALEPPPAIGRSIDGSAIQGLARFGERILLVVEPGALVPKEQLDADFDALEAARQGDRK